MNKKQLNRKITLLVIVFLILSWASMGGLAIVTWIYMIVMVRKKKSGLFLDQMDPKLAESSLTRLKRYLKVAGIMLLVAIVGIFAHNVISGLYKIEDPISFLIGVGAQLAFTIETAVCLVIFFKGRQKLI